jgi:hypothetical protein
MDEMRVMHGKEADQFKYIGLHEKFCVCARARACVCVCVNWSQAAQFGQWQNPTNHVTNFQNVLTRLVTISYPEKYFVYEMGEQVSQQHIIHNTEEHTVLI